MRPPRRHPHRASAAASPGPQGACNGRLARLATVLAVGPSAQRVLHVPNVPNVHGGVGLRQIALESQKRARCDLSEGLYPCNF